LISPQGVGLYGNNFRALQGRAECGLDSHKARPQAQGLSLKSHMFYIFKISHDTGN